MHAEAPYLHPQDPRDRLGPALALAIGLHLLLLLAILLSSWLDWNTDSSEPAAGSPAIEASLDMSAADARAVQQALREAAQVERRPLPPQPVQEAAPEDTVPPPQRIPEPRPQDSPVPQQRQAQERIPVPDKVDQDEANRLAISQEKAAKEQEAKRRQEQIDLTERQRQEEAEKQQRLARQQEEEQQKKLAQEQQQKAEAEKQKAEAEKQQKLEAIRAERAKLEREQNLAAQKLRQIADARARAAAQPVAAGSQGSAAAPQAGQGGTDDGLLAKYVAAIQEAVSRQWTRPDSVPLGTKCRVVITQLPGGEVMSAQVQPGCPMDQAGQDSLERAVLKAQPLPYRGFEPVFSRQLNFNFVAQDR